MTQLQVVNEYLKNIIFQIPGCVYWKDKDSVYQGANQVFLDMAGVTMENLIGKTDYDLCWNAQAEQLRQHDAKVLRTGRAETFEEEVILANGKKLVYTVVKSVLRDAKGKILGTLGTSLDITYLKEYETQLLKARRQAEMANLAKTEFIANVSHDLRTPITGMLGIARELAAGKGNAEDAQLLVTATQKLLSLLNEVIELVQSAAQYFSPPKTHFDLKVLMKNVLDLFAPSAVKKNLKLELIFSEKVPRYYYGYYLYLHRSLLNLLSNAIKFTQKGKITLSVTLLVIRNERATLQFDVIDTGVGIPEDKQNIIFERFSRLSSAYQGIYEGAGLGLSIVKNYIEKLRGKITVSSSVGKGSTFTCVIPLLVSQADKIESLPDEEQWLGLSELSVDSQEKNMGETATKRQAISKNTVGRRVLLVEDNLVVAKVTGRMLEELGAIVDNARSGEETIKHVREKNYDIIFMDIGLPDTTGVELTQTIRAMKTSSANAPIVALTGHMRKENTQQCFAAGMNEVLIKPVLLAQLQKVMQDFGGKTHPVDFLTPDVSDDAVIDLPYGARLVGGQEKQAREMLDLLIQSLIIDRPMIEEAFSLSDMPRLKFLIHKLRGGLSYCGVPALAKAVQRLEQALLSPNVSKDVRKLYADMIAQMDALFSQYKKIK